MEIKPIIICAAIAVSVLVIKYFTIPAYKYIFTKQETEKPIPARSEMIAKGSGVKPVIWSDTESKKTIHNGNLLSDTLTSGETIYLYPEISYKSQGTLEIILMSDSLSGCTNGVIYLDRNRDGIGWYNTELLRLNGSANQQLMIQEEIAYEKVRLRIVAAPITQVTKIRATALFKRT